MPDDLPFVLDYLLRKVDREFSLKLTCSVFLNFQCYQIKNVLKSVFLSICRGFTEASDNLYTCCMHVLQRVLS